MMKRFRLFVFLSAALLVLTACPKPEPEPVPDPDVTISLSQLSGVSLNALLDEDIQSRMERDGDACNLVCKGSPVSLSFEMLKDYDGAKPFKRYCNLPIGYDFVLGGTPGVPADASDPIDAMTLLPSVIDLGTRAKGTTIYFAGLPEEIVALDSMELTDDSRFELTLSFTSPWFTEGTVTPEFLVDIRKFFNSPEAEDGYLKFDVALTPENGYKAKKAFRLSSLAFDPEKFNAKAHNIEVEAGIAIQAKVSFDGLKTTKSLLAAAPADMRINAVVELKDIACKRVTGKFAYSIKGNVSNTVDLGVLSQNLYVDPAKASVLMDVDSDLSLAFEASSGLSTKQGRRTVGSVDGISYDIPIAEPGKTAQARYDLAALKSLDPLFAQTPTELTCTVGAASRQDVTCVFTLGETSTASFKPTVRVPLAFAEAFSREIVERIPVQLNTVAQVQDKQVILQGSLVNSLPLDGEISVVLVDQNDTPITREVKLSCAADATTQVNQPVSLSIDGTATQARVTYRFNGVKTPRAVKASDALAVQLSLFIPGE